MIDKLFQRLQENPVTQKIVEGSDQIGNLFPMEEALCLVSAFNEDHQTRIIVKKNRYEAIQLYNRISLMNKDTLLFTMEESLRVQAIASSPEDKQNQIYTLLQFIQEDKPRMIICNTAAFLRYLPNKSLFEQNCMHIQVEQEISMDVLKEKLNRAGYSKVNYCDRPCTYASRGGIIDIFSLEYENPIRIEFFDTLVESIRFFDVESQRTIKTISEISICPATDLLFSDEQILEIEKEMDVLLSKQKTKLIPDEYEYLLDHIESDKRAL